MKTHVYTDQPASNDALEDNIDKFIRQIAAEMMERVCENWTKWMDELRQSLPPRWVDTDYTDVKWQSWERQIVNIRQILFEITSKTFKKH